MFNKFIQKNNYNNFNSIIFIEKKSFKYIKYKIGKLTLLFSLIKKLMKKLIYSFQNNNSQIMNKLNLSLLNDKINKILMMNLNNYHLMNLKKKYMILVIKFILIILIQKLITEFIMNYSI